MSVATIIDPNTGKIANQYLPSGGGDGVLTAFTGVTPVTSTSGTAAQVLTLTLTAGTWLCLGSMYIGAPSATMTQYQAVINTSAIIPVASNIVNGVELVAPALSALAGCNAPSLVLTVPTGTTQAIYLMASGTWTGGASADIYGRLNAIRIA